MKAAANKVHLVTEHHGMPEAGGCNLTIGMTDREYTRRLVWAEMRDRLGNVLRRIQVRADCFEDRAK